MPLAIVGAGDGADRSGIAAAEAEQEAAAIVAAEEIGADLAHQGAVDLGDLDLEHDLLRRRGAQPAHHLDGVADEGLGEALGLGRVGRLGDRAGQEHHAVHRRRVDVGFGHRDPEHFADRGEVLADPDIGRIDHPPGAVGRIDRGAAGGLAENVDLAGRAGVDVGGRIVGDEHFGDRAGRPDHAALADRQGDVVGGRRPRRRAGRRPGPARRPRGPPPARPQARCRRRPASSCCS